MKKYTTPLLEIYSKNVKETFCTYDVSANGNGILTNEADTDSWDDE